MLVTEFLGAVASSPHGRSGLSGVRGSPLPQGLKQCHLGVRWGLSRLSWGEPRNREKSTEVKLGWSGWILRGAQSTPPRPPVITRRVPVWLGAGTARMNQRPPHQGRQTWSNKGSRAR